MAVIYSKQIATGVLMNMEEDHKAENSWRTTLEYNPDKEVSKFKRAKTMVRKVLPKNIL